MPRQNRVDPFGRLIAVAARGTLLGNRGCLHDVPQLEQRRTLQGDRDRGRVERQVRAILSADDDLTVRRPRCE